MRVELVPGSSEAAHARQGRSPVSPTSRSISRAGRARRARGNVATPFTAVLALFLATLLSALVSTIALAAPAHAADAYRFWGYHQLTNGTWGFATKGPDGTTPADGSVEGYRFALGDTSTPRLPRAVVTFDQACGSTPAVSGSKRVGVVVDFGRAADAREQGATVPAPYATCVTVPTAATPSDCTWSTGPSTRSRTPRAPRASPTGSWTR